MKTVIWFVLVVCCPVVVPAQERVIDKVEWEGISTAGYNHKVIWKGEKYRTTVTTSSKVTGRPQTDYSSKSISEFGSSTEMRSVYSSVFGGKPTPPRESLRIGDWLYTRSGNDAWVRKEYVPSTAAAKDREENPRKILSSHAEYKYLGQSTLLDIPVHIYLKTERQTVFDEKTGENAETESRQTYWVDGKGTILKSEYTSERRGKSVMHTSVILEYELDPSITFTVPEIAP